MKVRRFSRDEDGAVIIFAVVIFILMLIMGGLAVDMARTESHRVKMQSTLDRAVLAAADLDNTQDPKKVVEDYFAKAGLTSALTKVTVDPAFNGKYVKAEAREQVKTAFLHMVGVDSLTAPSAGAAQEMIANIEISLVVDVSGSMNGSRMNNLKTAAENFFYAVMDNGPNKPGLTSVSIIPYNAHVNFGSVLANRVNLEKRHNFSYCARFREDNVRDDFTTTAITKDTFIEREAHFYYEDNSVNYDYPPANDFWCRSDDNRTVMVHETDPAKLTTHIKSFWADGWTAVDQGMKVGAALLDPAFDDVIEKMADEKEIPLEVKGRPAPFTDDETMKIIVLMTDGANTVQRDLPDFAKTTMSPVWWSQSAANSGGAWYDGFYVDLNYEATPQNELVPGNRDWYRPRSPWSRNDDQWMGW
ncbi:MAG: TadE/TadG family type IV pilus assembly protein, partial [Pseudomonadota bacterium]